MSNLKHIILVPIRKLLRFRFFENLLYYSAQLGMITAVSKIAPGNNLYPINSIRKAKRNGINYILDLSDYQHWIIYFGITTDNPIGLFELIKVGDTLIDVGTNIGQTAMTFSKIGGGNSIVYGFEPDLVNYSKAIENLKINSFANIHLLNIGLGSKPGKLHLKINTPSNRGGSRIDQTASANSFEIPIETLDNIIEQKKITKIDLIKIDVEGFELEVIKGAKEVLKKHKPKLFIEVDDNNLKEQNTSAKELIEYLLTFGYTITDSKNNQIVKTTFNFEKTHFDVICL